MLLVTAATEKELCAALADPAMPPLKRGRVERLSSGRTGMLTLVTGVGIINAALHVGQALATHEISGVLDVGLAGSFDLVGLPLGTVCVVQREIWPEYGLGQDDACGSVDARALGFPLDGGGDDAVWDRIDLNPSSSAQAMGLDLGTIPPVTSLTVSTVSATQARAEVYRTRYSADIENMEGFALALACRRFQVPFLEIRAVSNLVGSRARKDWDLRGACNALGNAMETLLPCG